MSSKSFNILFIICHDIGRRYGCYGNEQIHTPNIDSLARDSVQFNNQFCQWPLCGPSRANIFSGCRPLTTKRFNNQPFFPNFRKNMGTEFRSLPEHFRLNGYQSLGTGLIYHDVEDPPSWTLPKWEPSIPQTIPEWADGWLLPENVHRWQNPHSLEVMRQRLERLQAQGYTQEQFKDPSVWRKAQGPAVESIEADDEVYYDGKVTRKALEYLDQMDSGQPFFLAVGYIAGHTPFMAPQKYWDLYDRQQLRLPENLEVPENSPEWASGDSEPSQFYTQDGYEKPWRANRKQSLELLHAHYAAISYTDAQVGKLIEALKSHEVDDNTVIVLVSDHGFHDGEHGYWGKHNLWDVSLQVPLLMRIPGMNAQGVQINALTEHVDIYPTLCDVCNLPKPDFLEGTSVMPLIENPERPWKQAVFAHRKHMWHDRIQAYAIAHTVRTHTRRLTVYLDELGREIYAELFDYAHGSCAHNPRGHDPLETINFANDPDHEAIIREMRSLLKAGWQDCIPR